MYNTIFVTLGEVCNFKCKYCLQVDNITTPITVSSISEKVYQFIINQAKENTANNNKLKIQPWGGEPLVYWDLIVQMVERLESENIKYNFGIVSNGALLTEDKVDYINKHNLSLTISHDGPYTLQTRGQDIFKDKNLFDLVCKVNKKGILSVMSAYNQDYYVIWNYFEDLFKDHDGINVNVDLIMETWDMPKDLLSFDEEKYSAMLDTVIKCAYNGYISGCTTSKEFKLINNFINRIKIYTDPNNNNSLDFLDYTKCGTAKRIANIDLDGNFYLCHNSSIKLGTIDNSPEEIIERFLPYNKHITTKECQACEVNFLCSGGCILIKEGTPHEQHCKLLKLFYYKIINMLLKFNNIKTTLKE